MIAHAWAVKAVGKNAALVLGELDFLDRAQATPGQPLTTRAGLIDALQGLVGRNAVDEAVKTLVGLGWVVLIERQTVGSNIRTWHEFALNAQAVSDWIENRESRRPDLGKAGVPESGPEPGPEPGPESGSPVDIEEEEEAESKPAPAAPAAAECFENPNPHAFGGSCRSAAPGAQGDDAQALAARLEQLRKAGTTAGDDGRDAAKLQQLADFGRYAGAAAVLSVISSAGLPGQALKACQDAGLDKAAAKAKAQAEAAEASARLAQQLAEGRKREEAYHSLIRQAYRQGAAHA